MFELASGLECLSLSKNLTKEGFGFRYIFPSDFSGKPLEITDPSPTRFIVGTSYRLFLEAQ